MFNPFKTNYRIQKEHSDGYTYFYVYEWNLFLGWIYKDISCDLHRAIEKVDALKNRHNPETVWKDW